MNFYNKEHFKKARLSEKKYHDELYNTAVLFKSGTWLANPVELVINSFKSQLKHNKDNINVLDLGCGVGRNSIPIAKMIKNKNGTITSIDLLKSAILKLKIYSRLHNVENAIIPIQADAEHFNIKKHSFDFIFSVSCVEHVSSKKALKTVISRVINGTKFNGSNCLMMYSNVKWLDAKSKKEVKPIVELNLDTNETLIMLKELYAEWNLKELFVKPWEAKMKQKNKTILFKTDCICLVADHK